MVFLVFIWLLIWGGMFTGLYNLEAADFLSSPLRIFQGVRAMFPIFAIFLCLQWILFKRPRWPFFKTPVGFLFAYGLIGVLTSVFLSVDPMESLYWSAVYISPFFALWVALDDPHPGQRLRWMISANYVVFFFIGLNIIPEAARVFLGIESFSAFYRLPFGLGVFTKNGAGRFLLIMVIVSFVRFITGRSPRRLLWLAVIGPAVFALMMTQSRTALLGLAVMSILYVLISGLDWRYVFAGPVVAYAVWTSGVKWRAQGSIDRLISLSGREVTWQKGLAQVRNSPLLGWGFNADRLMVQAEHMHNSFLQALIQTGAFGLIAFVLALVGIWAVIIRFRVFALIRTLSGSDQAYLLESVLIVGFMTARCFFESTAAFYGVDLLLLVPAMLYIHLAATGDANGEPSSVPGPLES